MVTAYEAIAGPEGTYEVWATTSYIVTGRVHQRKRVAVHTDWDAAVADMVARNREELSK